MAAKHKKMKKKKMESPAIHSVSQPTHKRPKPMAISYYKIYNTKSRTSEHGLGLGIHTDKVTYT